MSETSHRPASDQAYILVAVGDPVLHPEATHVAAATGFGVIDTADPREISRLHSRAHAILFDAETAAHIATLTRRPSLFLLAADPGPLDWRAALSCHAEQAYLLPAQAAELLSALGHAAMPRAEPRTDEPSAAWTATGTLIAVTGAVGGAGTSTLAAAIAREAAHDHEVTLIDGVDNSGGLDLLLGLEETPGARWPDLRLGEGLIAAEDLRAALPASSDGIAVLSTARSTLADPFRLDHRSLRPVLDCLREFSGVTVIDLPPGGHVGEETIIDACDLAVLLIPAEVRPAAAAARIVADLRKSRTTLLGIARHRGWSGLDEKDLAKISHCDITAQLSTFSRLPKAVELSGLPSPLPRLLAAVARTVLEEAGARA
ncbi:septum site-determining protein Ssd [Corynebacterium alimapuense]|uniref:Rv3660c-like CheY-like N-terminal domain-containing protein n=1 Tax=Corynebacterium alimapuense TaxID=1576874 RepID=A0A3M8K712_9CORY|nr:septum site-determining protein Ssd [Corynebacterium alimapuense]RNE49011.1 hypothetical protein C5L39_06930 [Corynebacterium alimapuense]